MKGIQFWAGAPCRSVMATYECIAEEFGVPFRVICENDGAERFKLGWDRDEYADLDIVLAASTFAGRKKQLNEKKNWAQWFSGYQNSTINCNLIKYAASLRCAIGIGSESPNNGMRPSFKRMMKNSSYYWWRTRRRIREVVRCADFIANYSGDATLGLQRLGWSREKIIPFGYFPRPLTGSAFRERTEEDWRKFSILVTGAMDWRRGQDVAVDAMKALKEWGYAPRMVMTQRGELFANAKRESEKNGLTIEFPGFVEYSELLGYYNSCSLFLAPGRAEPWGMRINDALNAGAPLLVSNGMGGRKIVDDCRCGRVFNSDDALDLAYQIRRMMDSKEVYFSTARNVRQAVEQCSPEKMAHKLVSEIRRRASNWN